MSLREDVAALYVDRLGPYPRLVREWYDEKRDGRTYAGPWPIVCHPPCGPWVRLHVRCLTGDRDRDLAPIAVAQVRRWGGVLEHPRASTLFAHAGLPLPQELPDAWGGRTIEVEQVAWGHACRKPTWLYVVGVPSIHGLRRDGEPTHQIWGTRTPKPGQRHRSDLKTANAAMRRRTPLAFAAWLLELASLARREVAA